MITVHSFSSNLSRKKKHGAILKVQLTETAGLTNKKPAQLLLSYIPAAVKSLDGGQITY